MTVDAGEEQIVALATWCATADARSAAGHLLRTRALPTDQDHVDDVLAEVQFRVIRRIRRGGPLEIRAGGSSPAVRYARTAMSSVVDDLLRGRRLDTELDGHDGLADVTDGIHDRPAAEMIDLATASVTIDEVRRRIHLALAPRVPWVTSAALAVITLTLDPGHPLRDATPQPDDGSDDQRAKWAAVFYAGRDDCFSDQGGEPDVACRNRRHRAIERVTGALADAYDAVRAAEDRP